MGLSKCEMISIRTLFQEWYHAAPNISCPLLAFYIGCLLEIWGNIIGLHKGT